MLREKKILTQNVNVACKFDVDAPTVKVYENKRIKLGIDGSSSSLGGRRRGEKSPFIGFSSNHDRKKKVSALAAAAAAVVKS